MIKKLKVKGVPVERSANLRLMQVDSTIAVKHIRYEGKTLGYPMDFSFVRCDPYMLDLVKDVCGDVPSLLKGYTRSGATLDRLKQCISNYDREYLPLPDDELFAKAVQIAYASFRVRKLSHTPLDQVKFQPDKSAGWTWLGKKKGEVISGALELSSDIKARAESKRVNFKYIPPCVAFVRTQLATVEKPKVRLVWGYPFEMTLLEGMFATPLIDEFSRSNVPMFIGRTFLHALPMKIDGMFTCHKYCNVVDWSGFDSSVSPELIRIAFGVLQQNFSFSPETRNLWKFLISYFIYTPIVFPDGSVYTKHGGIPSGSYFTSLIGSVINFIVVTYLRLKLFNTHSTTYVLGDDSMYGSDAPEDFGSMSVLASQVFGMSVNPSKCISATSPSEVDFLGHSARGYRVSRDDEKLLRLLVYPEYRVKSPEVANSRILGILADSGGTSPIIWSLYLRLRHRVCSGVGTPHLGPPGNFERYVLGVNLPDTLVSGYFVLTI